MIKKNQKKKVAIATACSLLLSAFAFSPALAEGPDTQAPSVTFEYCAIDSVPGKIGPDGYPYRCLTNDLFYIEYPGSWYFGSNKFCPIVFFNDSEVIKTTHDFETFQDPALIGTEDQVDQYIQGGGIRQYLQQVLNITDFSGCQFDIKTKEDTILMYFLTQGGETVASIVVWTSFGQISIRDERSSISMDPVRDYGHIMVMPALDSEDFSSVEAIQAYVDSGKLNSRLELGTDVLTWTTSPYQTEHHTYLACEGSCDFLSTTVYIPVTPAGTKNWMVSFQAYIDSEISYNAYRIREDIIKTFQVLK